MTTNIYLDSLLSPFCRTYGGCFSSDNISPVKPGERRNLIVNLAKEEEEGTHFVALIMRGDFVYYFDSFGEKCENSHILEYMNRYSDNIYYNSIQIQDYNSKMCGFFCALMVLRNDVNFRRKSDLTFHTTRTDLHLNDKLCVTYICEAIEHLSA
jgi:hypothetical protein